MALTLIVTNAGRAAIVNAQNTGTAPVTISQVGVSSTAVVPVATMTALAGELKRIATIAGDVVADDTIHLVARDESADAYDLKSFALYLADGTMFAIYGQPAAILSKTADSIALLQNDIKFADIAAASLDFGDVDFINPPATETVKGVAEIATQAETNAGADDQRIVTPKKMWTSILAWASTYFADVWKASNDGSGSGLDADLLDGQHGSWYADILARLGFTPANKAGDTFTGNVGIAHAAEMLFSFMASAGRNAYFHFVRAGIARWDFGMSSEAETGGNAGGNFFLNRFADNGAYLGTVIGISRATGVVTINGGTAWHSGNDGAGSGLDADLLDGQDSSYFTNIVARLGYTPLNAASYTASDILAKLVTVDGSGSGLDADLLDGIDSSGFIKASTNTWQQSNDGTARFYFGVNGITYFGCGPGGWAWQYGGNNKVTFGTNGDAWFGGSVQSGGFTATDGSGRSVLASTGDITASRAGGTSGVYYFGLSGTKYLYFDGSNFTLSGGALYVNGGFAWTSTNDGAGSGLDADLFDGYDSSAFMRVVAESLVENGGYTVFASGKKETWGYIDVGQDSPGVYNLPVAHTSWVNPVISAYTPYGITVSQHNSDFTAILYDGSGHPYAVEFWNADDRVVRFFVQTKGV